MLGRLLHSYFEGLWTLYLLLIHIRIPLISICQSQVDRVTRLNYFEFGFIHNLKTFTFLQFILRNATICLKFLIQLQFYQWANFFFHELCFEWFQIFLMRLSYLCTLFSNLPYFSLWYIQFWCQNLFSFLIN